MNLGTPPPSVLKGEVSAATWMTYDRRLRVIRRCMHCKRLYRLAHFAWNCEHWHERKNP